jgi:methionyl-tRNA formyltransferase
MKIAFFGTGEFAVPALRSCAPWVTLVVSQPDRPSGRGLRLKASPVKEAASEIGFPVETPEKSRAPEFVALLREAQPDFLLVASYGQILSQDLLDSAKQGGINLHGSILPEYRGAAPIQRCILHGRTETGVTLMHMDKGMDTGDVVAVERTPIDPDETYGELQSRLAEIAASMAATLLPAIHRGDAPRCAQDHGRATLAPKVSKEEAELNFDRDAAEEYNRFRAFTPSPGPFLRLPFGVLRLHAARFQASSAAPGTVLALKPFPIVAFQNGAFELREVQPEGKKRMSGIEFANGARLKVGERLGTV